MESYRKMLGKEGPQKNDMNGVSQSAEAVRKNMKERMKTNKIVNMRCFIKKGPLFVFLIHSNDDQFTQNFYHL